MSNKKVIICLFNVCGGIMLKGNIEKDMKSRRILIIFSKLSNGEKVNKKSLCLYLMFPQKQYKET